MSGLIGCYLNQTDELGETAEALDGEATKLEMESAKLKAMHPSASFLDCVHSPLLVLLT